MAGRAGPMGRFRVRCWDTFCPQPGGPQARPRGRWAAKGWVQAPTSGLAFPVGEAAEVKGQELGRNRGGLGAAAFNGLPARGSSGLVVVAGPSLQGACSVSLQLTGFLPHLCSPVLWEGSGRGLWDPGVLLSLAPPWGSTGGRAGTWSPLLLRSAVSRGDLC